MTPLATRELKLGGDIKGKFEPRDDFEGLITFTYKFSNPGIRSYNTSTDQYGFIDYIDSNEATVVIQVGKAVRVDLSIEGLEDETEDQGYGALLALNDDDDNQNLVEDLRELRGPATSEDDLTRVSIDYWLRDDAYAPDFTAHFQFGESIRLWTSEHKDEEILPSVEFVLTELPSEVYVEGIDRSTSGLKLVVKAPTSALFTDMVVPAITLQEVDTTEEDTVRVTAGLGLTAHRPMHGHGQYEPFKKTAVAEADEKDDKLGPGIRINRDDDNNNGHKDFEDAGPTNTENDLIEVLIERHTGQNNLILFSETLNIKVWSDLEKTVEIDLGTGSSQPLDFQGQLKKTVFIEWIAESHGTNLLQLKDNDANSILDELNFHTFQGIVMGFSGLVPDGHSIKESGMYGLATEIYKKGFDVYYFDEKIVESGSYESTASTGSGEAFTEILKAVQGTAPAFSRMVEHVGIFGHSYGGGATYDLAWRTNLTFGANVKIDYTAYIDAIRRTGVGIGAPRPPERQLPPPDNDKRFHDNFYQRIIDVGSLGLRGDTTEPSNHGGTVNNVDVNTQRDWRQEGGAQHVHTSIDDEEELWKEVVTHMDTQMKR